MEKDLNNISINCQSSIKISDGLTIYFDPYDIKEKINNADYIFITHSHWDHFDLDSINNLVNEKTIIIGPSNVIEKLNSNYKTLEVKPENIYNLNNISFMTVPAYNIDKEYHPKDAGYVGYIVTLNNVTYYIAGDTDVLDELKVIKADVIFLPVGGTYTMTKEEAVELANTIKPKYAIPIHYGLAVGDELDAKYFVNNIDKEIESKIFY
ncbi:MAG TPA: MBL fold metallo-hydrolase [Candidatus Onthousia excrementipullorum]|uniref:MBL fold metallo-hydrolase n=1 Tax=Candidatus Onthousia excrementipullorum TaxID=2840884 RepID=A0A9D1DVB3_9FIRM|nr:MBL fold metallo-hydrolase [Candidatus Onthousia excrementipullorum]